MHQIDWIEAGPQTPQPDIPLPPEPDEPDLPDPAGPPLPHPIDPDHPFPSYEDVPPVKPIDLSAPHGARSPLHRN